MNSLQKIEISWTSLWRIFIFCAIIAMIYFAWDAFSVLLVGIMLSLGIEPSVNFIGEKMKLGRVFAAIVVMLFLLLVFAGAFYLVMPVVFNELSGFLGHFTQSLSSIFSINFPGADLQSLGLDQVLNFVGGVGTTVPGAISKIFSSILLVFSALIITLYLSIEKGGAEKMVRVILPDSYERPVLAIFSAFETKMRRWLGAQLLISLSMGLLVGFGMWIIGVRYALLLGIVAAIFEVVPIIGPVMTGAVAFLVSMADSTMLAVYAVIFFFVIQQFESYILIPIIMGKSMRVHPVVAVVSILVGAQLAGFIGVILGVPIAVLVQEVFNYLAENKGK
ncbi:MAG: AI-2E family transporter [Minisyncoccia bacterium]